MPQLAPHLAAGLVSTMSAKEIAKRLRDDEALMNSGKPCSWIAWYLPAYRTEQGEAVGEELAPIADLSHNVKSILYENLLNKIKRHLKGDYLDHLPGEGRGARHSSEEPLLVPELLTTLKVLGRLQDQAVIQENSTAKDIMSWLEEKTAPQTLTKLPPEESTTANIPKPPTIPRKPLCYICRLIVTEPHQSHPSMCIPCGAFNSASSQLSLPPKLRLPPKFIALVTGARVNLGYHTSLRLLRCGARVIATTRYPRDAVSRFLAEGDSAEWKERLKIFGADFRSASDAFALVHETKRCLKEWGQGKEAPLSAIINNAAQTLTDSVKKEQRAIAREDKLQTQIGGTGLLIEGTYKARVRGATLPVSLEGNKPGLIAFESGGIKTGAAVSEAMLDAMSDDATGDIEPYDKSSWVQSLFEIPYEDLISAHAINTFVPLILIRELLPNMGHPNPAFALATNRPHGYIVNVSSREGIFEDRTRANAKNGKHVHTNMSKAALNMITETEAVGAWKTRRVAMNTVDPGYMSAAPECERAFGGIRPIGWEDGAGRVLWPIAVGELDDQPVWGRFLKHYGAVEVDPSAGRG